MNIKQVAVANLLLFLHRENSQNCSSAVSGLTLLGKRRHWHEHSRLKNRPTGSREPIKTTMGRPDTIANNVKNSVITNTNAMLRSSGCVSTGL